MKSTFLSRIPLFVVLTYGLSFFLYYAFKMLGGTLQSVEGLMVAIAYMFVPLTVVLILSKLVYKEPVTKTYDVSLKLNWWFVVAILLPIVVAALTFAVGLLIPGVSFAPDMAGMFERYSHFISPENLELFKTQVAAAPVHPFWMSIGEAIVAGISINALVAFGEELGWRGFLQRETRTLGFWKSSVFIGLTWGVWHMPLIVDGYNYPTHPLFGIILMICWCLLISPLLSYTRIKAKSVVASAVLHGTLNGSYMISIMLLLGGDDLTIGLTGIAGLIALLLVDIGIYCYDRFMTREKIDQNPFFLNH